MLKNRGRHPNKWGASADFADAVDTPHGHSGLLKRSHDFTSSPELSQPKSQPLLSGMGNCTVTLMEDGWIPGRLNYGLHDPTRARADFGEAQSSWLMTTLKAF